MNKLLIFLVKRLFEKGDKKRLKKDKAPEGVDFIRNQNYLNDGKNEHCFDVVFSQNTDKRLPTIFNIHGGAFVSGDKSTYEYYCSRLALKGYAVVNINYGLAPKYVFPSFVSDCAAAINFACGNAEKYHIDTNDYCIVGDSAGGMISAHIALISSNPLFAEGFEAKLDFKPKALGLSCAQLDFDGKFTTNKFLKHLNTYFGKKKKAYPPRKTYDIFENITKDFPPAFLTSCADDILFSDSLIFEQKLNGAGVKNKCLFYDETHNPLGHVYNYRWIHNDGREMPEAAEATNLMIEFFSSVNHEE